jgi:type I restriction-modification system DNA methylase subunit
MTLTQEQKDRITKDLNDFADKQYGTLTKEKRKNLGAFYTPPALVIKMIEKLNNVDDDICDCCIGAGNLIVGAIIAGADPKRCYGIELDEGQAQLCRDRLATYGVPPENIVTGSCLDESSWEKLQCYKKKIQFGVKA